MISSGSMCQVMVTQKSYNLYFYLQSKHDCYYKKGTKHFRKWPYIDIITTCNHSCCHRHIVHVRSRSWGDFGMVVSCRTQGRRTGYGRYGARRTNFFFDPRKISSSGKKTGEKNVPRKKKFPWNIKRRTEGKLRSKQTSCVCTCFMPVILTSKV